MVNDYNNLSKASKVMFDKQKEAEKAVQYVRENPDDPRYKDNLLINDMISGVKFDVLWETPPEVLDLLPGEKPYIKYLPLDKDANPSLDTNTAGIIHSLVLDTFRLMRKVRTILIEGAEFNE